VLSSKGLLRIALPSDGELYEPALAFLKSCGLKVSRPNQRRYTGTMPDVPGTSVLFQRTADITSKVEDGSAELGIVGLDRYYEFRRDSSEAVVVMDDLGFGYAELVLAVPDEWVDVTTMADLADVAAELQERGAPLRVATKYPRLVERFLHDQDVHAFTLVRSSGTLEAAPAMGAADVIGDISATGTTLRENNLRKIDGGTVIVSQACLIANKELLRRSAENQERSRLLLERVEARLRADRCCSVHAVVHGDPGERAVARLSESQEALGVEVLESRAMADHAREVHVIMDRKHVQIVVDVLRRGGAAGVSVSDATYVFGRECQAYRRLLGYLEG
jgi:ATP phosphoribosyltransferase